MIKRIGIDLHGVIDSDIELFKQILGFFCLQTDIKIYIISGPPTQEILAELDELGLEEELHYHRVDSIVDHLKSEDVEMWLDSKNTWWASPEDWWRSKAAICERLNIDIMIDDTEGYKPYFEGIKTKFVLYTK